MVNAHQLFHIIVLVQMDIQSGLRTPATVFSIIFVAAHLEIAEGSYEEVSHNESVIEAYLGKKRN